MIHVCLTHDIDRIDKTHQYFTKPLKALKSLKFGLFFKLIRSALSIRHPYWGFDIMMQIEEQYGVKSTCFFLNEQLKAKLTDHKTWMLAFGRYDIHDNRIVNIIKELDSKGWEIGVHGSYRSCQNESMLLQEKKTLEEIVGHEVIGSRQHYLNVSENTFEIQYRCGFKYDSSWGLTKGVGFKEGKVKPFFPINGSDYCEIPMTVMDSAFATTTNRWEQFKLIMDEIDQKDAYLVINYHNNYFSNSDFEGYNEDYVKMIELLIERGAHFMTMGEAYLQIRDNRLDSPTNYWIL